MTEVYYYESPAKYDSMVVLKRFDDKDDAITYICKHPKYNGNTLYYRDVAHK